MEKYFLENMNVHGTGPQGTNSITLCGFSYLDHVVKSMSEKDQAQKGP